MPVRVIFYKDDNGSIPVIEWIDGVAPKVQDKVRARIEIQRAIDRKRKFELDAEKHTAGDPE